MHSTFWTSIAGMTVAVACILFAGVFILPLMMQRVDELTVQSRPAPAVARPLRCPAIEVFNKERAEEPLDAISGAEARGCKFVRAVYVFEEVR